MTLLFAAAVAVSSLMGSSFEPAPTPTPTITTSAADFVKVHGVCKPVTRHARAFVIELQHQLRRVASYRGTTPIPTSGVIGPTTLRALAEVQQLADGEVMGDTTECIHVATDVDVISEQVRIYADSLGELAVG